MGMAPVLDPNGKIATNGDIAVGTAIYPGEVNGAYPMFPPIESPSPMHV